jgi:hypothetical protein
VSEHLSLRWLEDTPAEKWLLLGKYCLVQSGQVPEVVDMLKATGTLRRRQGIAPEAEPQDPLPHPALETLWQQLLAWGVQWPSTLRRWLQWGAVHGDPQHWVPGWQGLQRRLQWVHGLVVDWLVGRDLAVDRQSPSWHDEWALLGLVPRLWSVPFQAAEWGFGRPPTLDAPPLPRDLTRSVQQHAQVTIAPVLTQLQGPLVRTALEAEQQAQRLGQDSPQLQGHAAVLARLEEEAPAWQTAWARTVRTELMDAYGQGAVEGLRQQDVAQVYRMPSARACARCKELYLMPDGAPRVFVLRDLVANGTNEGRKQADWVPVISATHPHCVCSGPLPYHVTMETTVFAGMRERSIDTGGAHESGD